LFLWDWVVAPLLCIGFLQAPKASEDVKEVPAEALELEELSEVDVEAEVTEAEEEVEEEATEEEPMEEEAEFVPPFEPEVVLVELEEEVALKKRNVFLNLAFFFFFSFLILLMTVLFSKPARSKSKET
jgi:hypothetical protein